MDTVSGTQKRRGREAEGKMDETTTQRKQREGEGGRNKYIRWCILKLPSAKSAYYVSHLIMWCVFLEMAVCQLL